MPFSKLHIQLDPLNFFKEIWQSTGKQVEYIEEKSVILFNFYTNYKTCRKIRNEMKRFFFFFKTVSVVLTSFYFQIFENS